MLIDQDKCRGWRMCVSAAARTRRSTTTGRAARPRSASSATRASRPASRPCARETCVGRIRYLGVLLYDADRIQEAASVEHDRDLYQAQLDIFLDPNDPKVIAQARARRHSRQRGWRPRAASPVYKMAVEWKVALPLHPEYRTLPMVWYVPPLSPISAAANAGQVGSNGEIPDVNQLRIPVKYLANLLTAGDTAPVVRGAGAHAGDARLPAREARRQARSTRRCWSRWASPRPRSRRCTSVMAIANYEDRFVIPTHAPRIRREHVQRARRLRLLVRQRLLRRHRRDQPVRRREEAHHPHQGGGLTMFALQPPAA